MRIAGSPGGELLRRLRKAAGRTQLWVEAEADLGTGYLQRIERGKIAHPERDTLERILLALGARFGERRDVLERFGYVVAVDPPDATDREWARLHCQGELDDLPFPAYAIDCAFRVIAWNRFMAALFGPTGARVLESFRSWSVLEGWFDPASPIGKRVAEPDRFLPAMLRAARFEALQFGDPEWHRELMVDHARRFPRFRTALAQQAAHSEPIVSARALAPVRLVLADGLPRSFRLSAEPFLRDPRFRLLFFFPADEAALRWCGNHGTGPGDATSR
jgi:transcriptional regulator with XRE-family HTH domain